MIIKEVTCKSLLNKSGLADYCINPYTGCAHACVYCYARFMTRYSGNTGPWGSFVNVKVNAADVLAKEVRKRSGSVFISSVTDAYQQVEKKYALMRKILPLLAGGDFRVTIQTKSDLVLRDIDLILKLKRPTVGFTITTFNEDVRKRFEPLASPVESRLRAMEQLKQKGVNVYAFLGPFLPLLSEDLLGQAEKLSSADFFYLDKLNIKCGNWSGIENVISRHYPRLLPRWKHILFDERENRAYYEKIKREIKARTGAEVNVCF